jgi:hypothetical protein
MSSVGECIKNRGKGNEGDIDTLSNFTSVNQAYGSVLSHHGGLHLSKSQTKQQHWGVNGNHLVMPKRTPGIQKFVKSERHLQDNSDIDEGRIKEESKRDPPNTL